jgi:hypothetical protein
MLKKRTMQKLGEFEAFTLNFFGYGYIEFDKWLLFLTCVVAQTMEKLPSVSVKKYGKVRHKAGGLGFTQLYGGVMLS